MDFSFGKWGAGLALSAILSSAVLAQMVVPSGGTVDIPPGGAFDLGCSALDVQGVFNVNAGQVNDAGGVSIGAAGAVNGGSGTISLSGNWSNGGSFQAGSGSVVFTDGCATGPLQITGATVFNNLTLTSTNGRTFVLPAGSNVTVNGTLVLQGAAGQPIQLVSSSGQTAVINLGPQAQVVRNFATVAGTVQIGMQAVAHSIPTMNVYSLLVLALLLAAAAYWRGGFRFAALTRK